jgi:uncharacterized protein
MEPRVSSEPRPVSGAERLFELDLVRGAALLGILIMNMPGFATSFYSGSSGSYLWANEWDQWTALLRNVLFSGKFNSMFSLLFGIGFTIQLQRLIERRGSEGMRIYLRRLAALFLFGAVHALVFWTGDVLHMYALLGLLLVVLRHRSDRTIWLWIAACLSFPIVLGVFKMLVIDESYFVHVERAFTAWVASNDAAYGAGSFVDAMREHTREIWFLYTDVASIEQTLSFYVQLTTSMLLGFLIGRHRIPQRIAELMPSIVRLQYWSLGIGIGSALLLAYGEETVSPIDLSAKSIVVGLSYVVCRLALMFFYVTTLVRLAQYNDWRARFDSIAAVGRMPLTNYLMQTAIATTIFYGWGLGFWNRGGPLAWLLLALAIFFLVQVPLSRWWLARFQYGLMEYLWRLMTYGRSMSGTFRRA